MSLKVGFFGSPEHSKVLLEKLEEMGIPISFVVTNMDKPVGRKQILTPTPVKVWALERGIPVIQSSRLRNDESAQKQILERQADLFVVYAYGSIIPENVYEAPKFGSINLHGSLLPAFRGASPVQSFLFGGGQKTGISIQYLAPEIDSGDLISQVELDVSLEDNTKTLLHKMTELGSIEIFRLYTLLVQTEQKLPAKPQTQVGISHCKKLGPKERPIDWNRPAFEIHNQVRALYPDPLAISKFREKNLLILETFLPTETIEVPPGAKPGSFFLFQKKRLFCLCGDGNLLGIESLLPEGKKPMKGFEFFHGARVQSGETFT